VREWEKTETEIALHAMTGGARYWNRTEQNTKKSEDMRMENRPDDEGERAMSDGCLFDALCKSSPTQDRENKKQERANGSDRI